MQIQMESSLKQTASQKMIQSAQILQRNTAELRQYLQELSLENPLMEFVPPAASDAPRREPSRTADEQNPLYDRQERATARDIWNTDATQTLSDVLLFQLSALALRPGKHRILEHMIYNLDSNGYLSVALEDIQTAFGSDKVAVTEALALLQNLEPCGVGARDLSECLCIQLRRLHPNEGIAMEIAREELELLGKNQLPGLAKKLHQPLEAVLHARDVILSLNPRPGASYGDGGCMPYIYPELLVFRENGEFYIRLNESQPLTVQFDESYLRMLQGNTGEVAAYLQKKKEQLEWVQQCIVQRNQTLLSLGNLILREQRAFFSGGSGCLRNYSQAEAARTLCVHESTVSRAIQGKYLQCTWGIFPLQYFFPQGLERRDEICLRIQQMIVQEDKRHPLSDQALCAALEGAGLPISRRMVSKYRAALKIPDAGSRRKYDTETKDRRK